MNLQNHNPSEINETGDITIYIYGEPTTLTYDGTAREIIKFGALFVYDGIPIRVGFGSCSDEDFVQLKTIGAYYIATIYALSCATKQGFNQIHCRYSETDLVTALATKCQLDDTNAGSFYYSILDEVTKTNQIDFQDCNPVSKESSFFKKLETAMDYNEFLFASVATRNDTATFFMIKDIGTSVFECITNNIILY